MASFKVPTFSERTAAAAASRQAALEKLKAKPPIDPQIVAARIAAKEARDAAAAERRAAKLAAAEEAKAAKIAEAEAKAAAILAAAPKKVQAPVLSEAQKKAMRDARYAARKGRK
jgi:hypothetical protein